MSERHGPKSEDEHSRARSPGQSKWTLFSLALIVVLLVLLFDFNAL